MSLLEVRGLTKRFGGLVANDGIDLDIEEGQIVGLIGPNGSGKSTFFNCLSGFYPPDAGTVRYRGKDITGWPANEICALGIARTFQLTRVFGNMTALENVMVGAFLRTKVAREATRKAMATLELTGLADRSDLKATELTVPDQKRLELARVLATEPKFLMLDEVMAGLTPKETYESVGLLTEISRLGITLFIVEHVMEVIMPICTKVMVLNYGKKLIEDVPERVVKCEDVVKAYLGEKYRVRSAKP